MGMIRISKILKLDALRNPLRYAKVCNLMWDLKPIFKFHISQNIKKTVNVYDNII